VDLKKQIYAYGRRIDSILKKIENSIDSDSRARIIEFYQELLAQGYSKARVAKYLETLERIARLLKKPLVEANRDDIAGVIREIGSRDYSDWTKRDYKIIIKIFYRWLRKTETYPQEVRWIKPETTCNNMLPEELLAPEEVTTLVETAWHPRDKALLSVLYESGCRVGEILSLRIKNVQFDEYGAKLIVEGKTGSRRVRVIASAPRLATWIDNHPLREDPDAPLWVNLWVKNKNAPLSYGAFRSFMKDLARKAGIKKRIYPHLFRHSRATHLANHLTEAQMKEHFGWVQDSKMASVYVHLSGRDVDKALLRLHGLEVEKNTQEEKFKLIVCPRCKENNSPDAKFCNTCGLTLNLKTAMEMDAVSTKANELMTALIKNPEILDVLLSAMKKLENEKT